MMRFLRSFGEKKVGRSMMGIRASVFFLNSEMAKWQYLCINAGLRRKRNACLAAGSIEIESFTFGMIRLLTESIVAKFMIGSKRSATLEYQLSRALAASWYAQHMGRIFRVSDPRQLRTKGYFSEKMMAMIIHIILGLRKLKCRHASGIVHDDMHLHLRDCEMSADDFASAT